MSFACFYITITMLIIKTAAFMKFNSISYTLKQPIAVTAGSKALFNVLLFGDFGIKFQRRSQNISITSAVCWQVEVFVSG